MIILKISFKHIKTLSKSNWRILFAGIILLLAIYLVDLAAIAMVGAMGTNNVTGISHPE